MEVFDVINVRYCVVKGTTIVIDGSLNPEGVLIQNALNAGYDKEQVEILTQEQYDERKALVPIPKPPLSEIEKLRLEQAQSNAELVQLIMMMGGE